MKKILFVLLVAFSVSSYSQQRYAIIRIKSITPDTLYAGDSVVINFVWSPPTVAPFIDSSYFNLFDNLFAGGGYKTLWSGKWQELANFPKINDSVQQIRLKIPSNADTGHAMIFLDNKQYPLYIKYKTATSIKYNTSEGKIIETRYFNLKGEEFTLPVYNEVFIKIDIFEDGSFRSRKLITVL